MCLHVYMDAFMYKYVHAVSITNQANYDESIICPLRMK